MTWRSSLARVAMEGESSYRGHDGVRRWWKNLLDVFPDWNIEVLEVRDLGDVTVADLRVRGHGAGSGAPSNRRSGRWPGGGAGSASGGASSSTRAEALEAVGLSEQDAHADS